MPAPGHPVADAGAAPPRLRVLPAAAVLSICAWWLLYSLLYAWSTYLLAQSGGREQSWEQALRFGLNVGLPFILPTCLVWWVVMRYPLERGRVLPRIALYALAMLAASVLRIAMREVHYRVLPVDNRPPTGNLLHEVGVQISLNFMWFLAFVLIAYGWGYYQRTQEQRLCIAQMETRLAQTRLDALRAQLNPHFLFNALSSVAEVVHTDPAAADHMLVALGALLRDRLGADTAQLRPLREELALVRDYLEIEQMRLGARMQQAWQVDEAALSVPVPPLSVQVLVENAVVHAIARRRRPGQLSVSAAVTDGRLRIVVENSLPGDPQPSAGAGIGLASVVERLQLIYGPRATLRRSTPDGLHRVEVDIPVVGPSPSA